MAAPAVSPRPPLCPEGTIIKGRWKIGQQIGMGAFGEIYVAKNIATEALVAIKVEQVDEKKQALRAEVAIMRKLQGCPYVCQFISCGRQDEINYLVMELLGENLSDLRKRQPKCLFSMPTCCRLAIEMILSLQAIHELGVLHRDVKPSNFVLGRKGTETSHRLYTIDFGLSRRYVGMDGETKPPRANAGFRGTARYASVNSHACRELAPRDDLWSVLYVLVEFATGTLPWRQIRDRDKVGEMKTAFMSGRRLVDNLPTEFEDFMNHLLTLDYYSRPNYAYCADLFRGLLQRTTGINPTTNVLPSYDWERLPGITSLSIPPIPQNASTSNQQPLGGTTTTVTAAATNPLGGVNTTHSVGGSGGNAFPWPLFRRTPTKPHKIPVGSVAPSHIPDIDAAEVTGPVEVMTAGDGIANNNNNNPATPDIGGGTISQPKTKTENNTQNNQNQNPNPGLPRNQSSGNVLNSHPAESTIAIVTAAAAAAAAAQQQQQGQSNSTQNQQTNGSKQNDKKPPSSSKGEEKQCCRCSIL